MEIKNKILEKSGYDEVMHTDSYTGDMQGMNASSSDMGSLGSVNKTKQALEELYKKS